MVSRRHIPAVKRRGKRRISHSEVPDEPCIEEIPRRAISEDVSKSRPKRMPSGYIFHGLHNRQYTILDRSGLGLTDQSTGTSSCIT